MSIEIHFGFTSRELGIPLLIADIRRRLENMGDSAVIILANQKTTDLVENQLRRRAYLDAAATYLVTIEKRIAGEAVRSAIAEAEKRIGFGAADNNVGGLSLKQLIAARSVLSDAARIRQQALADMPWRSTYTPATPWRLPRTVHA